LAQVPELASQKLTPRQSSGQANNMFIIKNRKIFYIFSAILLITSIASLFVWGLELGIDFKGGSAIEVRYVDVRPEASLVEKNISALATEISLGNYVLQSVGDTDYSSKFHWPLDW
jgi:preprotein translocase subunit SecF